jgi:hypothetical protein
MPPTDHLPGQRDRDEGRPRVVQAYVHPLRGPLERLGTVDTRGAEMVMEAAGADGYRSRRAARLQGQRWARRPNIGTAMLTCSAASTSPRKASSATRAPWGSPAENDTTTAPASDRARSRRWRRCRRRAGRSTGRGGGREVAARSSMARSGSSPGFLRVPCRSAPSARFSKTATFDRSTTHPTPSFCPQGHASCQRG